MFSLVNSLPQSVLQDEKFRALAQALDAELARLSHDLRHVLHLPRLQELSGEILDLLNWQVHTDFYEPLHLSDEVKRNLIAESITVHRLKGTKAAVERVNSAFGRDIKIEQWWEYGGSPYRFRAIIDSFPSQDSFNAWLRQLADSKNVRSWVDIAVNQKEEEELYLGMAAHEHGHITVECGDKPPFIGTATYSHGKIVIDVAKEPPFIGTATYSHGRIVIDVAKEPPFVGMAAYEHGHITVECGDKPPFIGTATYSHGRIIIDVEKEPPFVGTAAYSHGKIIIDAEKEPPLVGTATYSHGKIIIDVEKNSDPGSVIPDDEPPVFPQADFLRLHFHFASWDKVLTLADPRPDLTSDDVHELGQFAAENKLLKNGAGEPVLGICRVDFITEKKAGRKYVRQEEHIII